MLPTLKIIGFTLKLLLQHIHRNTVQPTMIIRPSLKKLPVLIRRKSIEIKIIQVNLTKIYTHNLKF